MIVNSEKGQKTIDNIKDKLEMIAVDFDKAVSKNGAAINGAAMNDKHTALFDNIDRMTVHQIVEKYIRGSIFKRILNKLKR